MAKTKTIEGNPYRSHLRSEMLTLPALEKEWREANDGLKMAEKLVRNGDKTAVYIGKFQDRVTWLAKRIREIKDTPRLLGNTCQDPELLDAFAIAQEIRTNLVHESQRAAQGVQKSEESRLKITSAIRAKLGSGATLKPDDPLPWETGGFGSQRWAVRDGKLFFDPNQKVIHESNVANFYEQWREVGRDVRMAQANLQSINDRLEEATKQRSEIRKRMIDSPI